MKIGIDVRYLSHGLVGGVHTYVRQFVPPLLELAHARAHEVVLYADTKRPLELTPDSLPKGVSTHVLNYRSPLSSAWHDWTMRGAIAHDGVQVMHFPANIGVVLFRRFV